MQTLWVSTPFRGIWPIREYISDFQENRNEIASDLADQRFLLHPDASVMPIYGHRYVICSADPESSVVLSVVVRDVDAIVYANSLREYLKLDFLGRYRLAINSPCRANERS